jgi:hypothetical protein
MFAPVELRCPPVAIWMYMHLSTAGSCDTAKAGIVSTLGISTWRSPRPRPRLPDPFVQLLKVAADMLAEAAERGLAVARHAIDPTGATRALRRAATLPSTNAPSLIAISAGCPAGSHALPINPWVCFAAQPSTRLVTPSRLNRSVTSLMNAATHSTSPFESLRS